jgi:hypothetical protein
VAVAQYLRWRTLRSETSSFRQRRCALVGQVFIVVIVEDVVILRQGDDISGL